MAGTIEVRRGERWTAATWLFEWVLSQVADDVRDTDLAGHLRGIVGENLDYLSLAEVTESQARQFWAAATELPSLAEAQWREFEGRDQALSHLAALLALPA